MPCAFNSNCEILSSTIANIIQGYNLSYKFSCCTGDDCNNKYQTSYCISSDLLSTALKNNTLNLTNAVISQSCNSNSITTPSVKITISINLKVNLVYISDYSNLTSAASLLFIQNLKNFVSVSNKKS